MYTTKNFKTKKELKRAVDTWNAQPSNVNIGNPGTVLPVKLFAPGIGKPNDNGTEYVEGPHYPAPHTWYAQVEVRDGIVVKVK